MEQNTEMNRRSTGTPAFNGEEQSVLCEYCKAPRKYKQITVMGVPMASKLLPCGCSEGRAAYEREQARLIAEQQAAEEKRRKNQLKGIKLACGIPLRYCETRFDDLSVDSDNSAAIARARELADNFERLLPGENTPAPVKNGLYICGTIGAGKTCLASALANAVLESGYTVRFTTMMDLLSKLADTMNCGESLGRIINDYKTARLLVIDDLGKEVSKDWGTSKVFDILNARYENCLPTIITTNYSNEEIIKHLTPRGSSDPTMARSITDRIRGMCRLVVLAGDSRRGR